MQPMKSPRKFRPSISDVRLEERVVMATSPTAVFAPAVTPHVTSAQADRTLNQIHAALLSIQNSVTNAILYTEFQVNAGQVSASTASGLLQNYIGNKAALLFFQT